MKKKNLVLIGLVLILLGSLSFLLKSQIKHETEPGTIDLFYSDNCPFCAKTRVFLHSLEAKYPQAIINHRKVSNQEDVQFLFTFYEKYQVPKDDYGVVPVMFLKDKYFVGFSDGVGQEIEQSISNIQVSTTVQEQEKETINLPLIGEIDPVKYSFPVLAVFLGFFDGFNVCSLGALVLILGLVLVLKSRKKILVFGGIFVLTTALVYGLLVMLWYHLFVILVPYLKMMEIVVGVLGVTGGFYFLIDFLKFRKQGPACEMQSGFVTKLSSKVKNTLQNKTRIIPIMITILVFSVIITIAEFPCSAAVPLFFAGTLADAGLSGFQYIAYIALFILFYMIDEIVVFLIASFTMTIKLASKKFIIWITLIESIVLFTLGLYYLFGFLIFS